jgi:hypothetical protein
MQNDTSHLFKNLQEEIRSIKTRKFHVVEGPLGKAFRESIESSGLAIPESYRAFLLTFGESKLYRVGGAYALGVRRIPEKAQSKDGERLLCIGHYWDAAAYFKLSQLDGSEAPVFEWSGGALRKAASGFAAWLDGRSAAIRKQFGKKQWQRIVAGPPPFTAREKAIVAARKRFQWQVVGIHANGNLLFEVRNGSDLVLPFLSIGIRSKDRSFEGRVWLPMHRLSPEAKLVIQQDCYKDQLPAVNVEAYVLPDPEPEDREEYWEFRS